ncbi:hypothetical protein I79_010586 [Cricetulus griseus]|uniref:Uncharacterized protein n=1 Tax=Cricetulus griseus TaxID=10029 RepID=G3HIV8_CRIGR|nr:hypothetical protein I79_010586 [Cricetulus griseus]
MDLCEFKASLVSRASARIGSKATQRNPVLKTKTKQNKKCTRWVMAHNFNPSSQMRHRQNLSESEAILVYRVTSSIARATQRNRVSKIKQNKLIS